MQGKGYESKVDGDRINPLGGCRSTGQDIEAAGASMEGQGKDRDENRKGRGNRREAKLVPLEQIPGAREILLEVLHARPGEVHAMSVRLRKDYPGRTPGEILDSFRRLRDNRAAWKGKHATLSKEDVAILRAGYAAGRAGARAARKEVLKRRPDLNRNVIDWMVRQLGLTTYRLPVHRWSHEDHGYLMFWSEEKSVKRLAARFKRTEGAVRGRLSRYGAHGRVRMHHRYSVREAAALLGVSRTTISIWTASGLLRADPKWKRHAITEEALRTFCKRHPEKIGRRRCSPKVLSWLSTIEPATRLNGRRGHLVHTHTCPKCGQTIRGNGYSTHEKSCGRQL